MEHFKYLKYIIRHKWYVAVECWKRGLYLRALTHDWSKFLPDEWLPYCEYFYGGGNNLPDFNRAWLKHIHRNPHHWQHWVLREDDGETIALQMPEPVRVEMICDWIGAGKAIHGNNDVAEWYTNNRDKQVMHPITRAQVDFDILCEE